jgi:hypothetical protein
MTAPHSQFNPLLLKMSFITLHGVIHPGSKTNITIKKDTETFLHKLKFICIRKKTWVRDPGEMNEFSQLTSSFRPD